MNRRVNLRNALIVLLCLAGAADASVVNSVASNNGIQQIANSVIGSTSGGSLTGMTVQAIYNDPSLNETATWVGSGTSGNATAASGNFKLTESGNTVGGFPSTPNPGDWILTNFNTTRINQIIIDAFPGKATFVRNPGNETPGAGTGFDFRFSTSSGESLGPFTVDITYSNILNLSPIQPCRAPATGNTPCHDTYTKLTIDLTGGTNFKANNSTPAVLLFWQATDQVTITAEPVTSVLLGAGLLVISVCARRKQRARPSDRCGLIRHS